MLPREAVVEFAQLYKSRYQVQLTVEEAEQKANKFYNLMKTLILNSDPNLFSNTETIRESDIELVRNGGEKSKNTNRKFKSFTAGDCK